ncbi:RdgB/HAM1 family non-canonical purine NTP pyrophosphatase [Acidobacteriota bacterium]
MTERARSHSRRRLLLATTNQGKTRELRAFLYGLPLDIYSFADFPPKEKFEETGQTFMENARGKSLTYSMDWEDLTLAEDSGIEILHLGGRPGVFSARFAGSGSSDQENIDKALKLMGGVPPEDRTARFVCCLALAQKGQIIEEITGEVEGILTEEPRGNSGFGYDPIFLYPPMKKTFAELTSQEKNRISHRGLALEQLKIWFEEYS